ncbi:MAG: metal ABC transporter permease [Treponema sp.]|nr:metal ABC transporter permease [Treponema sp.]
MARLFALFVLPPVLRGFIALLVAGATFPLCGVMVLHLNLVPLRYMLMHGVILGGAVALAFSLPLLPSIVVINVLLVIAMIAFTKNSAHGFGSTSAAAMVVSMALASFIMHVRDVPAKDTLSLMWGSPFALTKSDILILMLLAFVLALYTICNFKNIIALFYNQEIAFSLGINVRAHYTAMILIVALTVALAMKLLGAFLIDALLILPVLTSSLFLEYRKKMQGIKMLFIASSIAGFLFAFVGYVAAIMFNFPTGATVALVAGVAYVINFFVRHLRFTDGRWL